MSILFALWGRKHTDLFLTISTADLEAGTEPAGHTYICVVFKRSLWLLCLFCQSMLL